MPTESPLISCTMMSGPFVIQGNSAVIVSTLGPGALLSRRYFFCLAAAAARSCATSLQPLTMSLPWVSSMSARTGLPWAFIFTTPIHCGGSACWSQPRMMTFPHGKSISKPSLNAPITLSVSVLLARLMASAMMYALA